ncbi:MAG: ROK family protein [Melioribacteraceae bacterium]|nr:ROK family protein [Melioribacteraceae bacterium]MCF8356174.1 ROK family protein [Melioribacteraceae bacterium]MCF8394745.1 ROK family protein [Melioribacteraceae bacterium]MCF8417955.1 ROK family protein [Melioribacteraceae bacterium]
MKKEYVITVDLGGTKILSALMNFNNEIIDRVKLPTKISKGVDALVADISTTVNKLLTNNEINQSDVAVVAMGVPGTVDPYTGLIGNAPNLGLKDFNIKEALQSNFDIPVLIENDVNIAGMGIKKFELNDEVKNMLVVFIGTGIGGALFFNGKLYRGSNFFAGEIGHMQVNGKGSLAKNAVNTTFETLAARPAIVDSITKDILSGKKSLLSDNVKRKKRIKSKALANAVKKKDKVVIKHLSKACEITGTVLGSLTTLLNVDTIIIGGGVVEAMDEFMIPKIQKAFDKAVLPEPGKHVKIKATKLGDDAPLFGGIALAEEFLTD